MVHFFSSPFQYNNHEIRSGKHIGVCISVANNRLFVGSIPKSKTKEQILEEFSKVTGKLDLFWRICSLLIMKIIAHYCVSSIILSTTFVDSLNIPLHEVSNLIFWIRKTSIKGKSLGKWLVESYLSKTSWCNAVGIWTYFAKSLLCIPYFVVVSFYVFF